MNPIIPLAAPIPLTLGQAVPTVEITLTRFKAGSHVEGKWVAGAVQATYKPQAIVVPATPAQIRMLPEGKRTTEAIRVFIPRSVVPEIVSVSSTRAADRITVDGKTYEVNSVGNYDELDFRHWDVLATKLEDTIV